MSDAAWEKLVERYRGDRRILCNCRKAWCTRWRTLYDGRVIGECSHGCASNLIDCRNEIAARVCAELGI
jgi:hypothetical protein